MHKLYIVGIGPGDPGNLTPKAREALESSDLIAGYKTYIDLISPLFPGKEFYHTGMRSEVERCKYAIEKAMEGMDVSIICSGDAGVYGMSGLVLELLNSESSKSGSSDSSSPDIGSSKYVCSDSDASDSDSSDSGASDSGASDSGASDSGASDLVFFDHASRIEVSIIPGISAALSGAALLGAPLMNDFCVISLSDLMTPWDKIKSRLIHAAQGDFCICIYNPSSKTRNAHFKEAIQILLSHKKSDTVCGIAGNIGRTGEYSKILTLEELESEEIGMNDTVFIGDESTMIINGYMVTPRGYLWERK